MEEIKEALVPEVVEEEQPEKKELFDFLKGDPLTEPQLRFATCVAQGMDFVSSWRMAYPHRKDKDKWVKQYASKLANNPRVRQQIDIVQQAVRLQIILDAPRAANKMSQLSESAKSETVQLEATKDILNRAGLAPPQRTENLHVGIFGSASAQDIRNLLRTKISTEEVIKEEV